MSRPHARLGSGNSLASAWRSSPSSVPDSAVLPAATSASHAIGPRPATASV